jgi:hypothetical protein
MYTILVTDSNELVTTMKERIMQRSKLVDNLHFLVSPTYKGHDMSNFTVMMEYITPVGREYKTELLTKSDALYKDMLEYRVPFDTCLTKEPGKVEVQLTFTKVTLDADGGSKQQVRKTSPATITIVPISAWSDIVPDSALSALDQRLVMLDAYAGQLADLGQYMFENKADNIMYDEESQYIQLTANGEPIGDQIKIVGGSAVSGVVNIEINENNEVIVHYADGTEQNLGKMQCDYESGIYVPSLVQPDKLTFTLQEKPGDPVISFDINPNNEWSDVDGPVDDSNYVWETL